MLGLASRWSLDFCTSPRKPLQGSVCVRRAALLHFGTTIIGSQVALPGGGTVGGVVAPPPQL